MAIGVHHHGSQLPASIVVFGSSGSNVILMRHVRCVLNTFQLLLISYFQRPHSARYYMICAFSRQGWLQFVGVCVQVYVVCSVKCNMCEKNVYIDLY